LFSTFEELESITNSNSLVARLKFRKDDRNRSVDSLMELRSNWTGSHFFLFLSESNVPNPAPTFESADFVSNVEVRKTNYEVRNTVFK